MASKNPLIQDLIENEAFPSVAVALPTGGRWYADGVLAEGVDPMEVEVGVLGILAEQNYRDPWLLVNGESIPRMLKSVCPSVLDAHELSEIDLEAILLASRLVSFGPKIELKHLCRAPIGKKAEPETDTDADAVAKTLEDAQKSAEEAERIAGMSEQERLKEFAERVTGEKADVPEAGVCAHENTVIVDVNEHILRYAPITDEVVAERFTYALKRVNQTVHLRPMPYKRVIGQIRDSLIRDKEIEGLKDLNIDALVLNDDAVNRYSRIMELTTESGVDNIVANIFAVATSDGTMVNGDDFIREWLLGLPTDEAEDLVEKMNELTKWFQSFSEIKYKCGACGAEQVFRLELDAERLFGRAGVSSPPKKPSQKSKSGARRRRVR